MISNGALLSNARVAELLALAADDAKMPLQKALRRASRKAFLWTEEAGNLVEEGRSLTEMPAVGPALDRIIRAWIVDPPEIPAPPQIRAGLLTLSEARSGLTANPSWAHGLKGDLQMHTQWSDGSGTIEEMARAALDRGYGFVAITDHSKGLKIAGGIDEQQLQQQANEIETVDEKLRAEGLNFQVLRSIELNLEPPGSGDMDREPSHALTWYSAAFIRRCARKKIKLSATSQLCEILTFTYWAIRVDEFTIFVRGCKLIPAILITDLSTRAGVSEVAAVSVATKVSSRERTFDF
jgi:hypothetical protein